MKVFRIFSMLLLLLALSLFPGCKEAKEGADELADEVTGKNKIEKKLETEKKIDSLVNDANKKQEEALRKLSE